MSTWISTAHPGPASRPRRPPTSGRGCTHVDQVDELTHLVALQPADEVHLGSQPLDRRTLCQQLLGVVLADRVATGGDSRIDRLCSEPLGDPDDVDTVRPRPLDARRSGRAAASSSATHLVGVFTVSPRTRRRVRDVRARARRRWEEPPIAAGARPDDVERNPAAGERRPRPPPARRAPASPTRSSRSRRSAGAPTPTATARGRRLRTRSSTDGCTARARRSATCVPGRLEASTATSMTPSARPRHPAWTTTRPVRSLPNSAIGAQSATQTANGSVGPIGDRTSPVPAIGQRRRRRARRCRRRRCRAPRRASSTVDPVRPSWR